MFLFFFLSGRVFCSKEPSSPPSEHLEVPDLVLSLIKFPEEGGKSITDLSQPWAALVLLPHLR